MAAEVAGVVVEAAEEAGVPGELGPRVGGLLGVLGLPGPLAPLPDGTLALALEDAELCGVLGVLGVLTGLVGVPEGVLTGLEDGVVGPLDGELLGPPPEPPTPLTDTVWPLGSKRTCAVHGPVGSAEESTRTWIDV